MTRIVHRGHRRTLVSLAAALTVATLGCKKEPDPIKASPPPESAESKQVVTGSKRYQVDTLGKVQVTIVAPDETFKGETNKLSGVLDVNAADLAASSGEIIADLDAFTTHTFGDKGKDDTQTEHAHNWFEIGKDVDAKTRDDNRMARFTIKKIDKVSVKSIDEAKEVDGVRTVMLTASGTLRVHGRDAEKTVDMEVGFRGPSSAPSSIMFKTKQPLTVSLSGHDVKPRDIAGRFLAGALEKVGKKLDDKAQISMEGSAKPKS
ncbi:MAG: hypothetical protein NVSMB1_18860 [Polyangiales bacterium]